MLCASGQWLWLGPDTILLVVSTQGLCSLDILSDQCGGIPRPGPSSRDLNGQSGYQQWLYLYLAAVSSQDNRVVNGTGAGHL